MIRSLYDVTRERRRNRRYRRRIAKMAEGDERSFVAMATQLAEIRSLPEAAGHQ